MKVLLRKGYLHWTCPASICGNVRVPIEGPKMWNWNRSLDCPSLSPSIKIQWDFGEEPKHFCCHCNIADGVISFGVIVHMN